MSGHCDEAYAVYCERVRKARKAHKCSACRADISVGHYYCHVSWVFDGSAGSVRRCGACQATHVHLRGLCGDMMWPDERLACGKSYEDEWGDIPDDIERLPFLSADERGSLLMPVQS